MTHLKHSFYAFLFIAAFAPASAESFRIHALLPLTFTNDSTAEQTVTAGINDTIAVFLPDDRTYFEGIEVRMQIPDEISAWRDSVACSLYENITPVPDGQTIDYTGTRAFVEPLPVRATWTFQIPLRKDNSLKNSPYAEKIEYIPDLNQPFLFIRLQLAMKGVPEDLFNAQLKVTVKPLLIDKGRLRVSVKAPEHKPYTLFVDDKQITPDKAGFLTDPGIHTVNIVSDFYRNETRTIRIDQAKTTDISINLKSIEPTLLITAPDNAQITIDDEPYAKSGTEIKVTEGDHKIRFLMGNYEVIRTVTAHKGKSYTVSLSVDVNITEE